MVKANSPRSQAKSATIDFMSTDTAMESAECAVTARTPTRERNPRLPRFSERSPPFARHAVP